MTTDGKYCSLALLKQYLNMTKADSGSTTNPTVYSGAVIGSPDDNLLTDCILQAESAFEQMTGSGYDQRTLTSVQSALTFVDGNGWLNLFARERGPVTAVSAIQFRDLRGSAAWRDQSWVTDDLILPPYQSSDTGPHPESWHVRVFTATPLGSVATGQCLVRWTYTGGFATIPPALSLLVARMAGFIYKLREIGAGKVMNQPLGTITVPAMFPPDLRQQISLWSPVWA
jgi:hypothetical protein